jgi:hypothetical protein
MHAADLLSLPHPKALLTTLQEHGASDRTIRLFACACCRRIWPLLTDERSRRAVEVAELFAEGQAGREELVAAEKAARRVAWPFRIAFGTDSEPWRAAEAAATTVWPVVLPPTWLIGGMVGKTEIAWLLRDIFDATFRPVPVISTSLLRWNSGTIPRLAQGLYDDRLLPSGTLGTARLAVLADALQEAECDDVEFLAHLREPGPHVRGCWVVDALLGQE